MKVRLKNKGTQAHKRGRKRPQYQVPLPEHPDTNQHIEPTDIHANHLEAFNSALRRGMACYRRKTNTYAKEQPALQRRLDAYWVLHNFVRPHFTTKRVPAVALGILDHPLSWDEIFRIQYILTAAISAIDIALWDIKGKALGVPVYDLLGGRVRDKVVCYRHNHGDDTAELVESCLASVEEGWRFVRWGLPSQGEVLEPRQAVRTAIEQFQAVREAVGDGIELVFDVHTRLDLADVVWLCREIELYRPFFIEDPLRCENPDSFKTLRPRTAVPLAAGEQFSSKWEIRQLVEEELIDYARIDLCIAGGFTEAKKIAGWCETHTIKLAVHNPLGPVSGAACLQLNLPCPNVGVQEQPQRPGSTLSDVVPIQPAWEDGYLLPLRRPGLGIEFDREAARKHPFQMTELPHLRRLDGSFTNW